MCDERQVRGRGGGGNPGGLKTRDPFFKFIIFLI
jgi:NADH:ubiquinone oxidoreductase subunit F (NADH-binding)